MSNTCYEWNIYEAWLNQVPGIGRQKMKRFCMLGMDWRDFYLTGEESLRRLITEAYRYTGKNVEVYQNNQLDQMNRENKVAQHTVGKNSVIAHMLSYDLPHMRGFGEKTIQKDCEAIVEARGQNSPERLYEKMIQDNIHYVNQHRANFPQKLREIPDSPYAIYVKGKPFQTVRTEQTDRTDQAKQSERPEWADWENQTDQTDQTRTPAVVAIIGARMCSEYGRYVAHQMGQAAAELGMSVVSGLASGIDGIAQNAARLAGGEVTAVLGCGVDICYPSQNRKIYDGILEMGRIVSEYAPGTLPVAQNFPPRNRIISGLSDAVVVVEAKKRSGTLITVDMALEQGRDIYAVPGRLTDPMSEGCNRLIIQGAQIVADPVETLLMIRDESLHNITLKTKSGKELRHDGHFASEEAKWTGKNEASAESDTFGESGLQGEPDAQGADETSEYDTAGEAGVPDKKNVLRENDSTGMEKVILQALDIHPKSVQEIYESICLQTEISLSQLQNKLLCMELTGQLLEVGGRYEKKYQTTCIE